MAERRDPPRALAIGPAVEADLALVLAFVRELAAYERLEREVVATEAGFREALFGARPAALVLVARVASEPAGFALAYETFSTFLGRRGLHLEDLFVRPAFRGRGVGRELLGSLARSAVERGFGRLEWQVLDWNERAVGFYRSLGARAVDGWTTYRLAGEDLERVARAPR